MARVLIVDDDPETREALAEVAALEGFVTATAGTLAEAREHLAAGRPDVVLIDLMLPDGQGLELMAEFEDGPRPEVVLITGHATVDSAVEALRTGARDYLASRWTCRGSRPCWRTSRARWRCRRRSATCGASSASSAGSDR
jgi:DNA-binding NtrC family response regulator